MLRRRRIHRWMCTSCLFTVMARRHPSQCEQCGSLTMPWVQVDDD